MSSYTQRSLKDKHVLISGASKGIGKNLAFKLAGLGVNSLVLLARNRNGTLTSAANELKEQFPSVNIHAVSVDVSDLDALKDAFSKIEQLVPHLDVVVANSAIMPGFQMGVDEVSDSLDLATFRINVEGYHFLTKLAMPLLWKSPEGFDRTIVYVSSSAGWLEEPEPAFGMVSYCTSKTATNGLMRAMHRNYVSEDDMAKSVRKDESKKLHRVVSVHPGFVQTGLGKETWADQNATEQQISQQKAGFGAISIDEGTDTLLWLVTAKNGVESGKTYSERKAHSF